MNDVAITTLHVTMSVVIFRNQKIDCVAFNFIREDYETFCANSRVQEHKRVHENQVNANKRHGERERERERTFITILKQAL